MARIVVGGFHHETNSFSPQPTTYDDYCKALGFPALTRGEAIFGDLAGLNWPLSGFEERARAQGHELVPTIWGMAMPGAAVTDHAFERIGGELVAGLIAALPVDAVYLCLHGAMVNDTFADAEAELVRRVRAVVGPDVPIVASLDLHANIGRAMFEATDGMVVYRTYPHVDQRRTGAAAADLLDRILREGRPAKAFVKLPFLMPLVGQCTMVEPTASVIAALEAAEARGVHSASFAAGFPPADLAECGPALMTYAATQAEADAAAKALEDLILEREAEFDVPLLPPAEAVRRAMASNAPKPVLLADTQDNPGAGGTCDTVGILRALIAADAQDAAVISIVDAQTAAQAHAAGEGATIRVRLGAKTGDVGEKPVETDAVVERLSDGRFTGIGAMRRGARYDLGPTALLRIGGVHVVVPSERTQATDRAILGHLGVEPESRKILVLKSSVHFRADFQPIASEVLVVEAPGYNTADHRKMPFRHLRPGLRLTPGGEPFVPPEG